MFGDTNICLRQGNMVLVDDDRLFDEMSSIVKEKKEDYSVPRYSGKDNSESGKDDTAMATVLSAFPPKLGTAPASRPVEKQRATEDRHLSQKRDQTEELAPAHGAARASRASRSREKTYRARRGRYR